MRTYRAVIVKINAELGYAFAKLRNRNEVFINSEIDKLFIGQEIKVSYVPTSRGFLAKNVLFVKEDSK